ncbi:MAG: Zn-dependent M28 family amino/carboxypeptidase [Paraglaciecola sp.]|jgi:Zn-dependent M28 family amino/carboxypeptidase
MSIKYLPLLSLTFLLGCNPAPEDKSNQSELPPEKTSLNDAKKAKLAITESAYTNHIKILASDEFGGRAPGTKGEELTIDYLTTAFKEIGLVPANGDSYTQSVPLTSVEVVNKPTLTFSGGEGEDLVLSYPENQVIWSRKQVAATSIKSSDLVFVGYGINAPERQWNDYEGIDVKGKTVVILINDPGYATQDPAVFNGNAMTYYGRWDYKFEEASKQGAVGAIMIHDTKPAAYGWPTVSASWTGPQFDMVRDDKGADLAQVEGWITKENAYKLFNKANLDLDTLYKAAQSPGFKAVAMNVSATAEIENTTQTINSQNVAAMIKGTQSPDDVFIYMAHWDHIGTDATAKGDGIYNGALDNATGTAALIEIAKAFKALPNPPKRSVMFLAVTAEEQGLLGSAYYAANPIVPLQKTIGGLNMDGLNNFGKTTDVTVIGRGMSELENYLEARATEQSRILKADDSPEHGYFYRSDHFELAKFGVPMLYVGSGSNHTEKGLEYGEQKKTEYLTKHYHGPSDEYDESWVMDGAIEDMQLYFLTGLDIINSGKWPNWNSDSEFKGARDAQMQK